ALRGRSDLLGPGLEAELIAFGVRGKCRRRADLERGRRKSSQNDLDSPGDHEHASLPFAVRNMYSNTPGADALRKFLAALSCSDFCRGAIRLCSSASSFAASNGRKRRANRTIRLFSSRVTGI